MIRRKWAKTGATLLAKKVAAAAYEANGGVGLKMGGDR